MWKYDNYTWEMKWLSDTLTSISKCELPQGCVNVTWACHTVSRLILDMASCDTMWCTMIYYVYCFEIFDAHGVSRVGIESQLPIDPHQVMGLNGKKGSNISNYSMQWFGKKKEMIALFRWMFPWG